MARRQRVTESILKQAVELSDKPGWTWLDIGEYLNVVPVTIADKVIEHIFKPEYWEDTKQKARRDISKERKQCERAPASATFAKCQMHYASVSITQEIKTWNYLMMMVIRLKKCFSTLKTGTTKRASKMCSIWSNSFGDILTILERSFAKTDLPFLFFLLAAGPAMRA